MSDRVYIFDTTLRMGTIAGLQHDGTGKTAMARKLVELAWTFWKQDSRLRQRGFRVGRRGEPEFPGRSAALARCCTMDVERAANRGTRQRPRIHTFIATSPIHLKYKLKKTRSRCWKRPWRQWNWPRHVDDVEFPGRRGAHGTGVSGKDFEGVVAAGARTVNIPDTVGYSTPKNMGY